MFWCSDDCSWAVNVLCSEFISRTADLLQLIEKSEIIENLLMCVFVSERDICPLWGKTNTLLVKRLILWFTFAVFMHCIYIALF